jgi:hypothetical protein
MFAHKKAEKMVICAYLAIANSRALCASCVKILLAWTARVTASERLEYKQQKHNLFIIKELYEKILYFFARISNRNILHLCSRQ